MKLVHNRKLDKPEYIDDSLFDSNIHLDLSNSIESWVNIGIKFKDYKYIRNKLQTISYSIGFDNLKPPAQKIVAEWFATTKENIIKVLTIDEQIKAGYIFNQNSIKARSIRFGKAVSEIYNRLSKYDADIIINDVETYNLKDTYVNFGREGTIKNDPEGLFDYITSTENTTWENCGLSKKQFECYGFNNMEELSKKIMDILNYGNYD